MNAVSPDLFAPAPAALLAGHISLSAPRLLAFSAVLILGSVPFSALGLCIGAHVRGSAAPGLTHLVYLPMLYLSGLFFPLPSSLQRWAVIWPSFHLERLALHAAGVAVPALPAPATSMAVLVAVTLVCGGIAFRRLARVG